MAALACDNSPFDRLAPAGKITGELFWGGDPIAMLIERIRSPETAEVALGRRRR